MQGSAGTTIVLSQLKQDAQRARSWMRKRLARRFGVIGPSHGFQVAIDEAPITTDDRDHFRKLEYLWCIGDAGALFREECKHIPGNRVVYLSGDLKDGSGRTVSGWVGTVKRQDQLDDGDNAIIVSAWGKLIHEDILKDLQEGGVFSKYLIGDIRADFVDDDQLEDIATSGQQSIKEDDLKVHGAEGFVQSGVLKDIQSKWREWRNEDGAKEALDNPAIKAWHDELSPDNRKAAKSLFARINSLPGTDAEAKAVLYRARHTCIRRSLTLNGRLSALDDLDDPREVAAMLKVFEDIDSLEAAHYYQISKGRLRSREVQSCPKSERRPFKTTYSTTFGCCLPRGNVRRLTRPWSRTWSRRSSRKRP